MASAVVNPAISIIRRTRTNNAACSGLGSGTTVSDVVMENSGSAQRLEVVVEGSEGSTRLDRVLATHLAELSRSRLKALILAGAVSLRDAAIRDPAYHVASGDTITIDVPEAAPPEPKGEDIALDIVFEDDDIVVLNKPKGLVVHPAAGHETGTLVNALIAHCGSSLSGIGGGRRARHLEPPGQETTRGVVGGHKNPPPPP